MKPQTLRGFDQVGVRELRQNLSKYLERIAQGETLEVSAHGRPVAILAPLPASTGVIDRLLAEGRMIPAIGSLADLGPPPEVPTRMSVSQALEELRGERL